MRYKLTFIYQYSGVFEFRESHIEFKEIESRQDVKKLYAIAHEKINRFIESIGAPIIFADQITVWKKLTGSWIKINE